MCYFGSCPSCLDLSWHYRGGVSRPGGPAQVLPALAQWSQDLALVGQGWASLQTGRASVSSLLGCPREGWLITPHGNCRSLRPTFVGLNQEKGELHFPSPEKTGSDKIICLPEQQWQIWANGNLLKQLLVFLAQVEQTLLNSNLNPSSTVGRLKLLKVMSFVLTGVYPVY